MGRDYQIGALWIGGNLSFLEQLCLTSFVDAGHHVVLYHYDPVFLVPEGVELRDANQILPSQQALTHANTASPALHSDVFRYHLLAQHDDMIWADTDAYCVKRFQTPNGHFYGWESAQHINGGVLGLPRDSATLAALLDFTSDVYAIPPWYDAQTRAQMAEARDRGQPVHAGEMAWGVWGPHAITHFLHQTGEARFALPREALYPFHFRDRALMLRPGYDWRHHITDQTFSIHFFGRRMRGRLRGKFDGVPRPRSMVGQLLKKHGIDPALAPIAPRHDAIPDEDGA